MSENKEYIIKKIQVFETACEELIIIKNQVSNN